MRLQVCMVLRYVADEITMYSDDIVVSQRLSQRPESAPEASAFSGVHTGD